MSNESLIAKLKQKNEDYNKQKRQLENRLKIILNKETDLLRRERTHNLIEKGAILESIFTEVKSMDAEETKAFLRRLKDAGNP